MADPRAGTAAASAAEATVRIDKFLWFARLAKTRSAAQAMVESGTIRLDGRRVVRAHLPVRVGSVIALVHAGAVRVLRVEALPHRRGPAPEAAALITDIANPG